MHTAMRKITHSLRNMVKRISARPAVKPVRKVLLTVPKAPAMERKPAIRKIAVPVAKPVRKVPLVQTAPIMERKPAIRKITVPAVQMPRAIVLSPVAQTEPMHPIGTVSHFYSHLSVAIIALTDTLRIGDTIRIKGHTTDFTQRIESMQSEHLQVSEGHAGQHIGVKVREKARQDDAVYKVG